MMKVPEGSVESGRESVDEPEEVMQLRSDFLDPRARCGSLALIVLNWQLPGVTPLLWNRAALRLCADGGANRLHDEIPNMFPKENVESVRARFLPNLVKGDLDSIRPDVRAYYQKQGIPIVDLSHDQDSTDLQKCVSYIERLSIEKKNDIDTIVAVGALGGRLDHILANLSTLHTFRHLKLILCGDGNIARLVPSGKTIIKPYRRLEGPSCGLVPMTGAAQASTKGLRWDMHGTQMHIGGLVSTSNILEKDEIVVQTDKDLVWTTELRMEDTCNDKMNEV